MVVKNYIEFHIGNITQRSHIDAVHAQNPKSDQYTGDIVLRVIKKINASGIIATISRTEMDINRPINSQNRPAIEEYRSAIKQIIISKNILDKESKLTKNYLHLAIHGMKDDRQSEFEIGTRYGDSCSKEVIDWFLKEIKKFTAAVNLNNLFPGDQSKAFHRKGDLSSGYNGYGEKFNTVQIEINRTLRKEKQTDLIKLFSNVMIDFDKVFNP
jgi:N-formylglutamate amidohydrolase